MTFAKKLNHTSIAIILYPKSHAEGKAVVINKARKIKIKNNKKVESSMSDLLKKLK